MFKKILSTLLIVTMLFSLVACGSSMEAADASVTNYLNAVKAKDREITAKYTNTEVSEEEEMDEFSQYMMDYLLDNLAYEIVSTEEDGDSATVTVAITNIDAEIVIGDALAEAFSMSLSGMSDEELNAATPQILKDCFEKHAADTVTNEVEIPLTAGDGFWIIEPTDELLDACLGGLQSALTEMGEME